MGTGLLYAATVFPVLAPLPPSLAGQALAFLVFVRNFGNILGITIGMSFSTVRNRKNYTDKRGARLHGTDKRAWQEVARSFLGAGARRRVGSVQRYSAHCTSVRSLRF